MWWLVSRQSPLLPRVSRCSPSSWGTTTARPVLIAGVGGLAQEDAAVGERRDSRFRACADSPDARPRLSAAEDVGSEGDAADPVRLRRTGLLQDPLHQRSGRQRSCALLDVIRRHHDDRRWRGEDIGACASEGRVPDRVLRQADDPRYRRRAIDVVGDHRGRDHRVVSRAISAGRPIRRCSCPPHSARAQPRCQTFSVAPEENVKASVLCSAGTRERPSRSPQTLSGPTDSRSSVSSTTPTARFRIFFAGPAVSTGVAGLAR